MPHEISIVNGRAEAAFALVPPWHNLGKTLNYVPTGDQIVDEAKIGWETEKLPMAIGRTAIIETPEGLVEKIVYDHTDNHFAVVRTDTGAVLGIVTDRYKCLQNREGVSFLNAIWVDRTLEFETAFALRGGKNVVIVARFPQAAEIVSGDSVFKYIFIQFGHGGNGAVLVGGCNVRPVCANTVGLAIGEGGIVSMRHTGNLNAKLDEMRGILGVATSRFDAHVGVCRELATKAMTRQMWQEYLDAIAPLPKEIDPDFTQRRFHAIQETRHGLNKAYYHDAEQQMNGVRGTAWAAFNAVTQVVDHTDRKGKTDRARSEARWNVTQYGTGNTLKQGALKSICKLTGTELDQSLLLKGKFASA